MLLSLNSTRITRNGYTDSAEKTFLYYHLEPTDDVVVVVRSFDVKAIVDFVEYVDLLRVESI